MPPGTGRAVIVLWQRGATAGRGAVRSAATPWSLQHIRDSRRAFAADLERARTDAEWKRLELEEAMNGRRQ